MRETHTPGVNQSDDQDVVHIAPRSLLRIGVIVGVGIIGTLDEVVLHQLLQWHNFYVHTTAYWRIVSDGIFHFVSSMLLVLGGVLLWLQRERISRSADGRALLAGIFLGAGGFNLYDGIVQHKILALHPVREGATNILIYDLVFNSLAAALLVVGWLLWRSVRAHAYQASVDAKLEV